MKKQIISFLLMMTAASFAQPPVRVVFTSDPAQPTTADSIRFQLFDSNGCCCAAYIYDSVLSVSDTTIILSFKADYDPCMLCDCALLGRWLPYKTAPLKTGTYGVYRLYDPCYPGKICPKILIQPVRIGQIIVTPSSSIFRTPHLAENSYIAEKNSAMIRFNARGEAMTCVKTNNRDAMGVFFVKDGTRKMVVRQAIIK
jgi:hypothetical protein